MHFLLSAGVFLVMSGLIWMHVSSADNLCKQFGPRSGTTECRGLIWIQTVCDSDDIPEIIFRKS